MYYSKIFNVLEYLFFSKRPLLLSLDSFLTDSHAEYFIFQFFLHTLDQQWIGTTTTQDPCRNVSEPPL